MMLAGLQVFLEIVGCMSYFLQHEVQVRLIISIMELLLLPFATFHILKNPIL